MPWRGAMSAGRRSEARERRVERAGHETAASTRNGSTSTTIPAADNDEHSLDLRPRRCANWFAAREDLDDDHRVTAVRANEGWPRCVDSVLALRRVRWWHLQPLTCEREVGRAAAVGQHAVVSDAVEAAWQHVQEKATHELADIECHGLVASAPLGPIVLPAEGHAMLVQRQQPAVGDGNPVRVT